MYQNLVLFMLPVQLLQINHQIPLMPLNYQPSLLIYLCLFQVQQNQMDHPSFLVILIIEQPRATRRLVASWVGAQIQSAMPITWANPSPFRHSLAWVRREKLIKVHFLNSVAGIHCFQIIRVIMLLIAAKNIGQQLVLKMYLLLIQHYYFKY